MPAALGVFLAAANAVLALYRPKTGFVCYVVLALLLPHVPIAGRAITYEILAFPAVAGAVVVRVGRIRTPAVHSVLLGYLVLVLSATVGSVWRHGAEVEWIRLQGLIRFIALLALAVELLTRSSVKRILMMVLVANLVVAVIQLANPGSVAAFTALYGRESQTVLQRYLEHGALIRPTGTLESPINLGAFAVLTLAVGYSDLLRGKASRLQSWLMVVLAMVTGVLSLTKTFMLGAPIVFAVGGLLKLCESAQAIAAGRHGMAYRRIIRNGGFLIFTTGLIVIVGLELYRRGMPIGTYVGALVNPDDIFESRIGLAGSLQGALSVITDNWLFGVGMTFPRGEFLGDSSYVNILHDVGVVGFSVVGAALGALVYGIVIARRHYDLVVVVAIAAVATGLSWITTLEGALGITLLIQTARKPRSRNRSKGRDLLGGSGHADGD